MLGLSARVKEESMETGESVRGHICPLIGLEGEESMPFELRNLQASAQ